MADPNRITLPPPPPLPPLSPDEQAKEEEEPTRISLPPPPPLGTPTGAGTGAARPPHVPTPYVPPQTVLTQAAQEEREEVASDLTSAPAIRFRERGIAQGITANIQEEQDRTQQIMDRFDSPVREFAAEVAAQRTAPPEVSPLSSEERTQLIQQARTSEDFPERLRAYLRLQASPEQQQDLAPFLSGESLTIPNVVRVESAIKDLVGGSGDLGYAENLPPQDYARYRKEQVRFWAEKSLRSPAAVQQLQEAAARGNRHAQQLRAFFHSGDVNAAVTMNWDLAQARDLSPEQLDSFAEAIFKAEVEEAAERGGVTVPELRRGLSADFAAVPSAAAGLGGYLFLESQLPGIQESAAQRDQYQRAVPPNQRRNPDRDRAREIERTLGGAREQGATDRSQEFKQWVEAKGIPYENALAQIADYYSFNEEGNRAVLNNPDEAPPILLDW